MKLSAKQIESVKARAARSAAYRKTVAPWLRALRKGFTPVAVTPEARRWLAQAGC